MPKASDTSLLIPVNIDLMQITINGGPKDGLRLVGMEYVDEHGAIHRIGIKPEQALHLSRNLKLVIRDLARQD